MCKTKTETVLIYSLGTETVSEWTITEFAIFCDLTFFVGMHDWCLYILFKERLIQKNAQIITLISMVIWDNFMEENVFSVVPPSPPPPKKNLRLIITYSSFENNDTYVWNRSFNWLLLLNICWVYDIEYVLY
jgi:hypothetical protein